MSVALKLRLARARLEPSPDARRELLDDAARELDTGLEELREIARGLHPAILSEHGLQRRSRRSPPGCRSPVDIDVARERLPERHRGDRRTTSSPRR